MTRGAGGGGRGARDLSNAVLAVLLSLAPCPLPHAPLLAASWPSLFRGVVVTDSPIGVRVVSVEPGAQAYRADLRAEDVIVRVHGKEIRTIDEFAVLSKALKGQAAETRLLVFRNGAPKELRLHLYSYPVLDAWGIEAIPDDDIRFAEASRGLEYWSRMGRGFQEAGKPEGALNAYLNALHNVPSDVPAALAAATLFAELGRRHVAAEAWRPAFAALRQSVQILERLFNYPLTDEQLARVRDSLRETVDTVRKARERAT